LELLLRVGGASALGAGQASTERGPAGATPRRVPPWGILKEAVLGGRRLCVPIAPVTLRDLRVFVNEAAEAIPPDDTRWAIDGRRFGLADTIGASLPE
jgi:hypothetical protein